MSTSDDATDPPRVAASGVGVIDKVVAIFSALAEFGPASLSDLVSRTGIPRPTAHRLAVALEHHGVVGRDAAGRFRLGLRLHGWGIRALGDLGLVEAAQPVLDDLREQTDESAQIYVREEDRRVCIAGSERRRGLRDSVTVGADFPLDRGSGGRVFLAYAPDASRFARVSAADREEIRTRGWASSVAEREAGVASVSAPVLDATGSLVAVVSVSGPADRFTEPAVARFATRVVAAARRLERSAGLTD